LDKINILVCARNINSKKHTDKECKGGLRGKGCFCILYTLYKKKLRTGFGIEIKVMESEGGEGRTRGRRG
jgi:hypothetical protein